MTKGRYDMEKGMATIEGMTITKTEYSFRGL